MNKTIAEHEQVVLERYDRTRDLMERLNADFSDEEVAKDAAEARRERRKRRGRSR